MANKRKWSGIAIVVVISLTMVFTATQWLKARVKEVADKQEARLQSEEGKRFFAEFAEIKSGDIVFMSPKDPGWGTSRYYSFTKSWGSDKYPITEVLLSTMSDQYHYTATELMDRRAHLVKYGDLTWPEAARALILQNFDR